MVLEKFDANYDQNILKITRYGQKNRYKFALTELGRRFSSPVDALDAGCGFGIGSDILINDPLVRSVTAIDIDQHCIETARQRYPEPGITFLVGDLEEGIETQKRFGLVTSMETIEHLDRPEAYLRILRDVTEDTGLLVLATPNGENTTRNAWNYRRDNEGLELPKGTLHVKEYTRQEMRKLLGDSGFEIQKEYGLFLLLGYALRISGVKPESRIDHGADGILQKTLDSIPLIPEIFSKPYPFLVGSAKNVIYVATKK